MDKHPVSCPKHPKPSCFPESGVAFSGCRRSWHGTCRGRCHTGIEADGCGACAHNTSEFLGVIDILCFVRLKILKKGDFNQDSIRMSG